MSSNTYKAALASAMNSAMEENPNTIIIGQGVTDFKGIFGSTTGMVEKFPGRVIETPLAEDSIAGICIGAALNGLYPINTHIRADFGLLIFNQLINLAAKYKYMFGGLFEIPMLFRFVIGRSWGQGAQHSQSLQSLMAHIPGLTVIMPSSPQMIESSYRYAREEYPGPVVSLEHRLMYDLEFEDEAECIHPFRSRIVRRGSDLTIVACSVMVLETKRASEHLAKQGIEAEVIDANNISDLTESLIIESVTKTGRLLVVDSSWSSFGLAAEISKLVLKNDPSILKEPLQFLGMAPAPCPTAKALEDLYYPDVRDICEASCRLAYGEKMPSNLKLPKKQSMTDFYKHFKGPF